MAEVILPRIGIYAIRNQTNDRVYVGSSVQIDNRWKSHRHRLRQGEHHSPFLQNAWNVHGEDAFIFEVLEVLDDAEMLFVREQFWIDRLGAYIADGGMNASAYAGASMRGRKLTAEHRKKIGDSVRGRKESEETKALQRAWHVGRPRSEETKAKLRAANLGKKLSAEHKKKIGLASAGKKRSAEACARMAAVWRGRKHTPETIAKMKARIVTEEMRERARGRRHSPETIAKLKARIVTAEHRAKITAAARARPPISDATREKLRIANLARWARARALDQIGTMPTVTTMPALD